MSKHGTRFETMAILVLRPRRRAPSGSTDDISSTGTGGPHAHRLAGSATPRPRRRYGANTAPHQRAHPPRHARPPPRESQRTHRRSSGRRYRAAAAPRARTPPSTPRTPHALAKHRRQQRRRRTSNARRRARTTTNDDEKMLRALTGAKPKTPIDGARENLVGAPATGPRCARGWLPFSSHASVA